MEKKLDVIQYTNTPYTKPNSLSIYIYTYYMMYQKLTLGIQAVNGTMTRVRALKTFFIPLL
jgi:hypothetical protein